MIAILLTTVFQYHIPCFACVAVSSPNRPRSTGRPRAAAAAADAIDNADESVDNMRLLNGAVDSEEYIRVS